MPPDKSKQCEQPLPFNKNAAQKIITKRKKLSADSTDLEQNLTDVRVNKTHTHNADAAYTNLWWREMLMFQMIVQLYRYNRFVFTLLSLRLLLFFCRLCCVLDIYNKRMVDIVYVKFLCQMRAK